MAMITSDPTMTLLNDVKPYKTSWKVEVKVLHSWTQEFGQSSDFFPFKKMNKNIYVEFNETNKIRLFCLKL